MASILLVLVLFVWGGMTLFRLCATLKGIKGEVAIRDEELAKIGDEEKLTEIDLAVQAQQGCLGNLIKAYKEANYEAKDSQQHRTRHAVLAAALSPGAVLFLSLSLYTHDGWPSRLLVSAEIILIIAALWTIIAHPFHQFGHGRYLPARIKAELLRREIWLFIGRVGPYLKCNTHADIVQAIERRKSLITLTKDPMHFNELMGPESKTEQNSRAKRLWICLLKRKLTSPIRSTEPAYWRDDLEDFYQGDKAAFEKRLRYKIVPDYGRHRLQYQYCYYRHRSEQHRLWDELYESLSVTALFAALATATLHLLLLFQAHGQEINSANSTWVEPAIVISALVLPTFGASFIALRSSFECHRLQKSFQDQAEQLRSMIESSNLLEQTFSKTYHMSDATQEQYLSSEEALKMMRLILRTETQLSHELRRWWHILEPEHIHGG